MKFRDILKTLKRENAESAANILILFDRLQNNETFAKMLSEITLPSDKYRAILKFANLLGISEGKFQAFVSNMANQKPQEQS